jgi:hypothetical protein
LSCAALSNLTNPQYYAPEKILVNVSKGVSLIEDTDGDGILDTTFNYEMTAEEKPDYIPGNSMNFYFIERKSVETIVPFSQSNKSHVQSPVLPQEEPIQEPFIKDSMQDVKLVY